MTPFGSSGLPFGAGGSGGSTPNATEQQLTGDWISDATTSDGEKVILNFNFSGGERLTTAKTLKVTGLTSIVSSGFYEVKDNNLILKLTLTTYQAAMILKTNPDELWIGSERYTRFAALDGSSISGQIHVAEEELNATVKVTSAPYAMDKIFVKYKEGTKAALKLDGVAGGTHYQPVTIDYSGVEQEDQAELQALTINERTLTSEIGRALTRQRRIAEHYEETVKKLEANPQVESVSRNYLIRAQSDPSYSQQENDFKKVQIPAAWDLLKTKGAGAKVVVAVIDSGVRYDHSDLSAHITKSADGKTIYGYDFVPETVLVKEGGKDVPYPLDEKDSQKGPDGDPIDPGDGSAPSGSVDGNSWHGTHVAGIIAAVKDNSTGISGIADNVEILPIRVLGKAGSGTIDSVVDGINYAAKLPNAGDCPALATEDAQGYTVIKDAGVCQALIDKNPRPKAKVINLSLGMPYEPKNAAPLIEAIKAATNAGILVVGAAGNGDEQSGWSGYHFYTPKDNKGKKSDVPAFYPAADENVLAVGALGSNGSIWSGSNYGPYVDVVAPGESIYSTIWDIKTGKESYGPRTGTSQATPFVSAIAALILAQKPDLTPAQVVAEIKKNAVAQPDVVGKVGSGKPLIKAYTTLASLLGVPPPVAGKLEILGADVNFGPYGSLGKVLLDNTGPPTTDLTWVVATTSAPAGVSDQKWFSVALDADNGKTINKSATLQFEANRKGLPVGTYQGKVDLTSAAGKGTITVEMEIKEAIDVKGLLGVVGDLGEEEDDETDKDTDGDGVKDSEEDDFVNFVDVGDFYVLLKDSVSGQVISNYDQTNLASNYFFMVLNIPVGTYQLEAGIDTNKDGYICDLKAANPEPCVVYPNPIPIKAGTHIEDIVINY